MYNVEFKDGSIDQVPKMCWDTFFRLHKQEGDDFMIKNRISDFFNKRILTITDNNLQQKKFLVECLNTNENSSINEFRRLMRNKREVEVLRNIY
jgi:hypothetical protein